MSRRWVRLGMLIGSVSGGKEKGGWYAYIGSGSSLLVA